MGLRLGKLIKKAAHYLDDGSEKLIKKTLGKKTLKQVQKGGLHSLGAAIKVAVPLGVVIGGAVVGGAALAAGGTIAKSANIVKGAQKVQKIAGVVTSMAGAVKSIDAAKTSIGIAQAKLQEGNAQTEKKSDASLPLIALGLFLGFK
jgi:hypothetical protein